MRFLILVICIAGMSLLPVVGAVRAEDDLASVGAGPKSPIEARLFLSPSERQHLDEFGAALRRFRGLSYSEFTKNYVLPADREREASPADDLGGRKPATTRLGYDPLQADFHQLITKSFPLTEVQQEAYRQNGFVVMNDAKHGSFLNSFYAVFREDLPVYISVDSVLDALHLSFDRLLLTVEEKLLIGELDQMLRKMEEGLSSLEAATGAGFDEELDDVAFWICTARSLLAGRPVESTRQVDGRVQEALDHISSATIRQVDWFGDRRREDFSLFVPRGHYTKSERLKRYFRTMCWCQRIGTKFSAGHRQASVAYLLTEDLYASGAIEHWKRVDGIVGTFIGAGDSLGPEDLKRIAESSGIQSAAGLRDRSRYGEFITAASRSAAGRDRINSQILRSNPTDLHGFTPIPPSFELLPQRFTVDSHVFTNVVFDRVGRTPSGEKRTMPSPLDAMFVLGNRTAGTLLDEQIREYGYQSNLAALEWIVSKYDEEFWNSSFYNVWLSSLKELNRDTTSSRYPSVMQTGVWRRRMLHAQLASWAQLRHDSILHAEPSGSSGECDYPDGWVDPYPEFYGRLADFAGAAGLRLRQLGVSDREIEWFFNRFKSTAQTLETIAVAEIEGRRLTAQERDFFRKWLFTEGSSAAIFTGEYADMIFRVKNGTGFFGMGLDGDLLSIGEPFDPTVADVHTDNLAGRVLQVAVGRPNLMLLSVKTADSVRAFIGPVFSYYEFCSNHLDRMTDAEWKAKFDAATPPDRPAWVRDFVR